MALDVFSIGGKTAVLVATTTSAAVALPNPNDGEVERTYWFDNTTSSVSGFVAFGNGTVEAEIPTEGNPAFGFRIPAGAAIPLRRPTSDTHVAGITSTGTATLYITPGTGF
jgi:hypothetical protein